MIQTTPHMRVLVAREPIDFRTRGRGTAAIVRNVLELDPLTGTLFVFRSKNGKAIRLLMYDGQGLFCADKILSSGTYRHWQGFEDGARAQSIEPHQFQALIMAGDWTKLGFPGYWRKIS